MNQAERDLIARLFDRIRGVEGANRDPEAEAYISEQVARQPHAPYAMAQTVVVQDRALEAANARIAELERELADARPAEAGPSPWGPRAQDAMGRPGGFGGEDGYGRTGGYASPPFGVPRETAGSPSGYGSGLAYGSPPAGAGRPPQQEAQRGGGFLSGALQTAAGVAAGALLFQGVRSLFGGEEGRGAEAGEAARFGGEGASETAGGSGMESISDQFAGWFGGDDRAAQEPQPDDAGAPDPDDGDDRWL